MAEISLRPRGVMATLNLKCVGGGGWGEGKYLEFPNMKVIVAAGERNEEVLHLRPGMGGGGGGDVSTFRILEKS